MKDYAPMARKIYAPVMEQYGLQFGATHETEFFLIGKGFALWVFLDMRDASSDTWYVSIDDNGNIMTYTLMYRMEKSLKPEDMAYYGKPETLDGHIAANMRVDVAWLLNRCPDLLSGDKAWLQGYEGKAH
jgi:hypothetical protein